MPFFGLLLSLTAIIIAGVAGYFSVYGLANIYQGAFLSVVLMGGSLEVGKLIATSYLYRYWATTGFMLKTYLMIAILGLMLITSSGIFGYLSNAYQQDAIGIKDVHARVELLDKEYEELARRESQIDADVNRVGNDYVTARLNLMKQYAGEKTMITERRNEIRAEKLQLASKQLEVEAHTGPIIYIAKAMGKTIDEAVMWMSLLIIFVFDPLAIALTIAANSVMLQHKQKKQAVEFEPKVEVVEVIKEVPASIPEGSILVDVGEYERMSDMISRADRNSATADDERAALNRMIEEQAAQLELIKTEKTKLLAQIEEMAESDRVEDAAHSRLEIALQHQASRLKEDVKQAEQDLAIALDALEKRDTKIENLERHSAELEQQIVELRMQLRKFEMTATERAKLHQQNVVQAKNN